MKSTKHHLVSRFKLMVGVLFIGQTVTETQVIIITFVQARLTLMVDMFGLGEVYITPVHLHGTVYLLVRDMPIQVIGMRLL